MRQHTWVTIVLTIAVFVIGLMLGGRLNASSDRSGVPSAPAAAQRDARSTAPSDAGRPVDTHLFRNIAKQLNPMVVFITTESRVKAEIPPAFGDEFFRQFFGQLPTQPPEQIQRALGSGFLVGRNGEILTNNHVVEGAEDIRVALFSDENKRYDAKVIGRDPLTDTALIRITNGPANLPVAPLGDSDALQPGDWVMAIGNPFNLGHTVTLGVVSYLGRPFSVSEGHSEKMIQTDASINPGNSGGPLIDTEGHVVGINAAILAGGEEGGGNIGIGFAVPINTAKSLLPQLRQGKVTRGRIGLEVTPVREDEAQALKLPSAEGALVRQVEQGSPAARAGIKPGDVVLQFNAKPVHNADDLVSMVTATAPGTRVDVVISRNGMRQTVPVTIEELQVGGESNSSNGGTGSGLALADLTPDFARRLGLPAGTQGALIENVQQGSAAQLAGLRPNDVILEVNHTAVHNAADAANALRQAASSQVVFLLISRNGNQMFVPMRNE